MSLIPEKSGGPGPASVTFHPTTAAAARSWFGAVRAVAESAKALAAAARATPSRASLLRATAAAGASIASTAVSCAAHDASAYAGALLSHAGGEVEGFVDDLVAGAFRAAVPLAAARTALSDAAAGDDALLAVLRGRSIRTIADTIDLMERIDAQLDAGDGLKAFNTLYLSVTRAVRDATGWENRDWILTLDVLFAQLYFDGLESCLAAPGAAPHAWRVLMDQRRKPGVGAIQYALAGMNAHINRDLAIAVVQTWRARGTADHGRGTPEFGDYARINDVLDGVEPGAMRTLATGLFTLLDDEPEAGWAAMAIIHAARDLAFSHAENLAAAGLDSDEARSYVAALDAVAADASRAALVTMG